MQAPPHGACSDGLRMGNLAEWSITVKLINCKWNYRACR